MHTFYVWCFCIFMAVCLLSLAVEAYLWIKELVRGGWLLPITCRICEDEPTNGGDGLCQWCRAMKEDMQRARLAQRAETWPYKLAAKIRGKLSWR